MTELDTWMDSYVFAGGRLSKNRVSFMTVQGSAAGEPAGGKRACASDSAAEDAAFLLLMLDSKDDRKAYGALLEMERLSEATDVFYPQTESFGLMTQSDKYAVRVRGFRLFCRQARWDREKLLDKNLGKTLRILNDDRPTAVRQALSALHEVVIYKPELRGKIREAAGRIDFLRYKESMQGLIAKDVQSLIDCIGVIGEDQDDI